MGENERAAQHPEAFGIGRLFWSTSEAIVGADLEAERIVLWNPAAERLFGYSAADALGLPLEVLVPEELRDRHLAGIRRYREGGAPVLVGAGPIAVPTVTVSGEAREVNLTLTDVSDGSAGRYVLALIRDDTQERRAQRELENTNAAMREFVATASHDLRTPLTSVIGFSQWLIDNLDTTPPERVREFLQTILRGAKHASRLVDDLLTLSQINAGKLYAQPERIVVADAVREAAGRAGTEPDIAIAASLAVWADPDHLERMLVNYLTNAERHGQPPIRVVAEEQGANVAIRVCDSGHGVEPDFVARLFTTFARADPSAREGTGLGLSIVKGLAQANGGDAFYEATADLGCCFGVVLPAPSDR